MNASAESAAQRRTYLTRADVARMLGVAPNTVTRWAREGRLPCQVTLGGHHRFDREVIEGIREAPVRGVGSEFASENAARAAGSR